MDELHRAARLGWLKGVNAALNVGADPNIADTHGFGNRPLHYAAEAGHSDIILALLQRKADVSARNWYGYTALHEVRSLKIDLTRFAVWSLTDLDAI